jgi:predicted enzyme related to lactoylglutathione lyase
MMKRAIALGLMAALSGTAQAGEVTLNAARVGAEDVAAAARFYEAAFGLQEANRLEFGHRLEVMLNFGATVADAKANQNAQVVIMHRESNALKDPIAHVILNVTDMAATAAAVKKAGGTMEAEPHEFGKTGIVIGFANDPAGNRIELIQRPKK